MIRSFNDDKPYNEFVQEQIAADEIWPDDNELQGLYILPSRRRGTWSAGSAPGCTRSARWTPPRRWTARSCDTTG